jgi:heptosyltransferase-2
VKTPGKILVFRQSSLGDVILTLPVVKELALNFPDSSIDFLTKEQFAPVIIYNPLIKNTLVFSNNEEFKELLKEIRSKRYDLIIDLQRNFRSIALSFFSPGSRRVKYKKRRLAREMIVRKPSINLSVDHTINAYFHTLRRLGIKSELSPPEMALSEEARSFADQFISESLPESPANIVALCPGARHHEKKWPCGNFLKVAHILLKEKNITVLIITSKNDSIPENMGPADPGIVPVKDFGILNVAALLSRCRVALTNDSGLMHLANAVGTRVVAIFGPTSPRLGFSPTLPGSKIINKNVFCSPCSVHGEKPCRQPAKYCFENISPEQVAESILEML